MYLNVAGKKYNYSMDVWSFVQMTLILLLLLIPQYSSGASVVSDAVGDWPLEDHSPEAAATNLKKKLSAEIETFRKSDSSSDITSEARDGSMLEKIAAVYKSIEAPDDSDDLEMSRNVRRKTYRNKYLTDPNNSPLQRKSAKKRFKADRNLQRVEKKSWNLPTQTLGHYLDIKDQAMQTARKAHELRKLLNAINDY